MSTHRTGRITVGAIAIAVVLPAILGGCGKICPEGTVRVGDFCKRIDPDVVVVPDVIITTDVPFDDGAPDNGRDGIDDAVSDTAATDDGHSDVPPVDPGHPVEYPGDYVGKPCNKPSECSSDTWPDGKCLSWPKGFCAMPGCDTGLACPEHTTCMNLAAGSNSALCTLLCEDDSDCRSQTDALGNGYACKLVPDPDGAFKSVCYMESGGAMHAGGPCEAHEDCADRMGCLPNFDGGYCAVLFCDAANPCPGGTVCTRLLGRGVCMKSCVSSDDCVETRPCTDDDVGCVDGVALSRACIGMKNAVTQDSVKVCGSGTVGKDIGEQCLNETECSSGKCNVSYIGKCTDFATSGRRCLSDADCVISGAICAQSSADTYGFCTAACSPAVCPGDQTFCVMTMTGEDTLSGMCVPACQPSNPEDPFSESDCWEEAGLRCLWGDSKFQPNVRSCVRIDPGDPGMSCRNDDQCYSGNCVGEGEGTDGVCAIPCLSYDRCPFPTTCGEVGGQKLCLKRCQSKPDCPGTMTCEISATGDYCAPSSI